MSYDVSLGNRDGVVVVENHSDGGTYVLGGTTKAELNITYNYGKVYALCDFSIKDLEGRRASDVIEKMRQVVEKLGTRQHTDYWAPTLGNAGYALSILLKWAEQYPSAIFVVA